MRILHVIANIAPRMGGPSKAVLEMSAAVAAEGHEVDVVTTTLAYRGSWLPWVRSDGFEDVATGRRLATDGYSVTYCRPVWPTRWAASLEMPGVLRQRVPGADVIHIHSLYLFPTLVASRLARTHGVPYLVRPHGTLDPYIRRRHRFLKTVYHALIEDSTLRHAAAIHFTTQEERELALPSLPTGVETAVVPLGVNLDELADLPARDVARSTLGIDHSDLAWLFLGRLNHKKGLDLLAHAFVALAKRVPNSRLIVAGPDDDGLGRRLAEECALGGVADRIQLTGFLDRVQMKRVLAAADLWILPSYSENFGLAVVEAMAAQLPVLVTDRVNIWRAVHESRAGVVTRAEASSVLDGMLQLARLSSSERRAMGERGRALCRRSFSWRQSAQKLVALYGRIAERRQR